VDAGHPKAGRQPPVLPARLIAIADLAHLGGRLVEAVAAAASGGVGWFLLRAKDADAATVKELAGRIVKAAPDIALSVHTEARVAMEMGAAGVHFGSAALRETKAEETGGLVTGYSCHDGEELSRAATLGADYVFLSPVFEPTSKKAHAGVLGVESFSALAGSCAVPVYGLGGMTPGRVGELARAGASGVAVLGDLFGHVDAGLYRIEARAREWSHAVDDAPWLA